MITLKNIKMVTNEEASLELYADALSELDSMSMDDIGLSTDISIQPGSFAYDKTGAVAIYDGTVWNTLE